MLWLTVIVFIALLLALVLVHEWGHFIMAKKAGCNVEEFAFGFPPRLFSYTWHGTKYSFNLLPIGGYVKIEGEDMEEEHMGPGSFATKSATWRVVILAAGVTMNVILAWLLLTIQGVIGVPTLVTDYNDILLANVQTYVLEVQPDSPAAAAGIQELDRITQVGGISDPTIPDIQSLASEHAGSEIPLVVSRAGEIVPLTLIPRVDPPADQGPIGISLGATGLERVSWWQAPWHGVERTGLILMLIFEHVGLFFSNLAAGEGVTGEVTGPIGIAVYTNEVTQLGLSYFLEFAALISLNLALINILPFPALDGGRIVFVLLEKALGRRVPGSVERVTHTIGFVLLIGLMILVTYRDVFRFIVD